MSRLTEQDLGEIYTFAVGLGRRAGQILQQGVERRTAGCEGPLYAEKDNAVDIVTQTDQGTSSHVYQDGAFNEIARQAEGVSNVETFIAQAIRSQYPSHKFVGEETYAKGETREYIIDEQPTWCVDPLDGTVNYTHLFPMFCVSIGFIVDRRPVIGVIYAPFLDQLFSSCLGRGAWLNETRRLPLIQSPSIPPMPAKAPSQCIFSCEWGKDRRDVPDGNLYRKVETFLNMAAECGGRSGKGGMVHGVRSLGSATLDLAYTAMGAFDIWWEGGCWEWDVAAGVAILLEAGGLVTSANSPDNPDTDPIPDVQLGGRLYLAIRPAGPSSTETGREGQERTVREVWRRVRALDYRRPGA